MRDRAHVSGPADRDEAGVGQQRGQPVGHQARRPRCMLPKHEQDRKSQAGIRVALSVPSASARVVGAPTGHSTRHLRPSNRRCTWRRAGSYRRRCFVQPRRQHCGFPLATQRLPYPSPAADGRRMVHTATARQCDQAGRPLRARRRRHRRNGQPDAPCAAAWSISAIVRSASSASVNARSPAHGPVRSLPECAGAISE
jgi:hypothetical protein